MKSSHMIIKLVPTGGLGNRMRAIASAVAIAQHYQASLEILWNERKGLNANFEQLFLPIDSPSIHVVTNKSWLYNIEFRKEYLLRLPLLKLVSTKILYNYNLYDEKDKNVYQVIGKNPPRNLLLVSGSTMCKGYNMKDTFVPCDKIRRDIDKVFALFSENTIGVHIRRTDNKESIRLSPLEDFYTRMEIEIAKDSNVKFYIATDDDAVKHEMIRRFPQRIITQFEKSERDSLEGMEFAVNDLYCLSKTKKIIGSLYSSYSHIASELGGIPIEYATKKK